MASERSSDPIALLAEAGEDEVTDSSGATRMPIDIEISPRDDGGDVTLQRPEGSRTARLVRNHPQEQDAEARRQRAAER